MPACVPCHCSFWAHEYEKHGTCCKAVFATEHDYFYGVLQLDDNYNLLVWAPDIWLSCAGLEHALQLLDEQWPPSPLLMLTMFFA
jgi:hypothetical protein